MTGFGMRSCILALALALWPGQASAQRLVTSLSAHEVMVTQSFTGENIVLFGTVEDDAPRPAAGPYDLVVTVTGPGESMVTWRKGRVLGIWAHVDSRRFINVPSYLAIMTTRPIETIANRDVLRRLQVGLDNYILTQRIGTDIADVVPDDPFRASFVRLQKERGRYLEQAGAASFLSSTLFRADIPFPAEVPFGSYLVDVKLFSDGAMIARDSTSLTIRKVGFEQFVANLARTHGLPYGLAVVAMAAMTGWLASVAFRRD